MSTGCSSTRCRPIISNKILGHKSLTFGSPRRVELGRFGRSCDVRASMVDSHESSPDFIHRMERSWLISQQPRPVACSSCDSNGHVECKWCNGTGFFILGDNMLCEVPSRNTTCVICTGKGSMRCSDCKGTGYRAKWMGNLPIPKI